MGLLFAYGPFIGENFIHERFWPKIGNSKYVVILDVTRSMHSELMAFNMGKYYFEAFYLRNGAS